MSASSPRFSALGKRSRNMRPKRIASVHRSRRSNVSALVAAYLGHDCRIGLMRLKSAIWVAAYVRRCQRIERRIHIALPRSGFLIQNGDNAGKTRGAKRSSSGHIKIAVGITEPGSTGKSWLRRS